jgi:hypothetical protein
MHSYKVCPITPGVYHANKMYLGNLVGLPPVMESNDYMLESLFYDQNKTLLQGVRIYSTVFNKIFGAGRK